MSTNTLSPIYENHARTLREAIARVIANHRPDEQPEPEDYTDTEEAFGNGEDIASWEICRDLQEALDADKQAIRVATVVERIWIDGRYCELTGLARDELPEHTVYVRDHYISDGPGYAGPVAIIMWGGAPGNIDVLTVNRETNLWEFETLQQSLRPTPDLADSILDLERWERTLAAVFTGDGEWDMEAVRNFNFEAMVADLRTAIDAMKGGA